MSSEPFLKTFRAITSAEAVGQDHPEHMTVLRTFISAPARPGSGESGRRSPLSDPLTPSATL